ncbi:MAG TPA: PQQ-binding-like beta-propeller repeat protein [Gemmata sp.]
MIRWAGCGLVLVFAAGASAQTADVITETFELRPALPLRPNPFGGAPVAAQPKPAPGGADDQPLPGPGGRRPVRPVLTHSGPPKLDRNGDPLPAGAVARYGSVRLRHGTDIQGLTFSFDGKQLCTASGSDDSIKLWDTTTGKQIAALSTGARLVALANAGFVVLVDETRCKVWLPATGTIRTLPDKTLPEGSSPSAVAVNPDSRSCAVAVGGKVLVIDLQSGKALRELNLPGAPNKNNENVRPRGFLAPLGQAEEPTAQQPVRLLYSPDGKWLAGSGDRTGVWLWDLRTGKRVRTYRTEIDYPDFAFSPDVTRIAITGAKLHLYALDSEEAVEGFKGVENVPLYALRFSTDGKTLSAMNQDGSVLPFDAETGEGQDPIDPPVMNLHPPLALAPGAVLAAAIDMTGGISIWNPKTGKGPEVPRLPALFDADFGPHGVTALDEKGQLHTFDPVTGAAGKVIDLDLTDELLPAIWDARSRRVARVVDTGKDLEAHFIDVDTKKVLSKVALPQNSGLPHVSFAAGARNRVALFHQFGVVVLNPATGKTVRTINASIGNTGRGAMSPDGRLVAEAGAGLIVSEVATGKKRFGFDAVQSAEHVAFSPDGRFLVADTDDGAIHLFDLRTGASVRKILNADSGEPVSALALSADGKQLAAGFASGHVTVWDVATGDVLAPFAGHDGAVNSVRFSADGTRLVSCAMDGTAVVWAVPAAPLKAGPTETAVTGFDEAFRLLGTADAAEAQRGLDYLYRHPGEATKQFGDRIAPPAPTPAAKLAQLVADLGSDDFPTREAAAGALEKLRGEPAPLLREAAGRSADAEVRKLATELLGKLAAPASRPDDLRVLRAVEVLEGLRTPEARALLEKWATGPRGHRITDEAAAAVARLKPTGGK